jgi:cytochrome P450
MLGQDHESAAGEVRSAESRPRMTCPHAGSAPVEFPKDRLDPLEPPPELNALREERPLCRMRYPDGHAGWLVTGYALARSVLVDPRFTVGVYRMPVGDPVADSELHDATMSRPEGAGILIFQDSPQHTRIRRALAGYFTVRRVGEHREAIERIIDERLDSMERVGKPLDLLENFALPIPSMAICEMLGAAPDDRDAFEQPSAVMVDPEASAEDRIAAIEEFFTFCRGLVAEKRAAPGDDLLSHLVLGGELSTDEIVGAAQILFEGGHATTASMFSQIVFALLRERSEWEGLMAEPAKIPNLVEEFLRYVTILPAGAFARTATEDLELEGVQIKAGESVSVSLAAANRDPEKFDHPDDLDLSRDTTGHVGFGHGKHMCIGQHLARLELTLALAALMRRFPALELAVPAEEVEFLSGEHIISGVHTLQVTW